jgi:rRNA maturation endonuclease Nob1
MDIPYPYGTTRLVWFKSNVAWLVEDVGLRRKDHEILCQRCGEWLPVDEARCQRCGGDKADCDERYTM